MSEIDSNILKTALDNASTNMMLADADRRITYVNHSVQQMLKRNEPKIREALPNFSADQLIGTNIDSFHKNPHHQISMLDKLTKTYETKIRVSSLVFELIANPIFDTEGKKLGYSVEWKDITQQTHAQEEIQNLIQQASQGKLEQRIDSSQYTGFLATVADNLNQLIDTIKSPLDEIIRVTSEQSKNNLTARIEKDFSGQFALAKNAINLASDNMNSVLNQAVSVVEQVSGSVAQLRSSSQSLAAGAEEQSSAIEEVSSNLSETDSQVSSNAENANIASQLSSETASIATDGQTKMSELVSAMQAIANSSDDITKIIKVIDDIAFQTNLLALNAAVEAARAGQHGKGFAVVAQEVRNLAGRSAKAAKETADLIDSSARRVKDGVVMANNTASVLGNIVTNVLKVKDVVAEIAAASHEQTNGITEINKAINQVSTAASASSQQSMELASASDQLASLTEQLQQEIGRFELTQPASQLSLSNLPSGLTPAMIEQIMQMMKATPSSTTLSPATRSAPLTSIATSSPVHSSGHSPKNSSIQRTGTERPKVSSTQSGANQTGYAAKILPLDDDERGFSQF